MFKCNTPPMQPLTEESESASDRDALTVASITPIHELRGQDTIILTRMKKIREIMEALRLRISFEKDNLARERMEAAALFMYQPIPMNREYWLPLPGFYRVPVPYSYAFSEFLKRPAMSVQDYESLIGTYNYISPLGTQENNSLLRKNSVAESYATNSYKEQLQDVEKRCQEEFDKMQESLSSLRKLRIQTKTPNSDEDISNFPDYIHANKRRHQKHDKGSHRRQQKSHHSGYRRLRQPNSILGDERTFEDHRNHYYQHYRHVPQKRRYFNNAVRTKPEDYSGDTTETSNPIWYLDSPCESDFD